MHVSFFSPSPNLRSLASRTLVRASRPPPGFPTVLAVSNLDLILGPFPIFLVSVYPAPAVGLDTVTPSFKDKT
jgi:hypothetical protein